MGNMKHGLERPIPIGQIGTLSIWCGSRPEKNCPNKTAMSDPETEGVSLVLNEGQVRFGANRRFTHDLGLVMETRFSPLGRIVALSDKWRPVVP